MTSLDGASSFFSIVASAVDDVDILLFKGIINKELLLLLLLMLTVAPDVVAVA